MTQANSQGDEGVFQPAINQALEKLSDANARLVVTVATLVSWPRSSSLHAADVGDQPATDNNEIVF